MRAKNEGHLLALAQRITLDRLTSGNYMDRQEAQSAIVASMLKERVEIALKKVNCLKAEIEKHLDGRIFCTDPASNPIHATLAEATTAINALMADAQNAYDATEADDRAAREAGEI